ncbi:VWA domain-containing protein [Cellulomonas sp. H30R-01]|uniref:GDSL-type esterase/lipase family protein n=1 Tax=Cellulomonas sp. H30R-01 TaxID=2704467 RepID=UPI00138B33A9|nr:GDSL-type esterase/lipase family protein [Cellulomonas sp. H30R-01]QHT55170.1 VWA domain-containing protein [Cellulomonas sp. H30R-01]
MRPRRPLLHRATAAATLAAVAASLLVAVGLAPAQAAPTGDAIKVVQIGDSYSAGNGAGAYYGPADCYRSHDSWAAEYSEWLADQGNHVTFVTRACSGAVSQNVLTDRKMDSHMAYVPGGTIGRTQEEGLAAAKAAKVCSTKYVDEEYFEYSVAIWDTVRGTFAVDCQRYLRAQIEAVGRDTDVVVFTMGGNDLGFADIVKQCFAVGFRDPGDCREKVTDARAGIGQLEDDLTDLLGRLRDRMRPDAKVVLLSYPYLSNTDSFVLRSLRDRLPFVSGDTYDIGHEVRALGDEGDAAQRAAVARANTAAGRPFVSYVDTVKEHFAGHEPDPSATNRNDDRWIHEFDSVTMAEWYHPTTKGHYEESTLLRSSSVPGRVPSASAGSIDLVFAIDTTGSMDWVLQSVKDTATRMVDHLAASSGSYRFALVTFRDDPVYTGWDGDYAARVDLPFTSDPDAIRTALAGMVADGGGDWPETALSGMQAAIDLPWRPGVKKVLIPISDAPAHDPEPMSGLTSATVIANALAVDPVEVYPIDVGTGAFAPSVEAVAAGTGGSTTTSLDVAETLLDTISTAMDKPYAWVQGPYVARVGDTLRLDARGSYATTGDLVSFEWDLDGDGSYDVTTSTPTLEHMFGALVDAYLAVRVTDSAGRASIATTPLAITDDGDETPADVDVCPTVADPGQEDHDGDGVGDACDPSPFVLETDPEVVVFEADDPGVVASSTVSGAVFEDADADGLREAGEGPAAGVAVTLTGNDAGGTPVTAAAVSAADGSWSVTGLLPGTYVLRAAGAVSARSGAPVAASGAGTAGGTVVGSSVESVVLSGVGAAVEGVGFGVRSASGPATPTSPPTGAPTPGGPVVPPAASASPEPASEVLAAGPSGSSPLATTGSDAGEVLRWAMLAVAVGALTVLGAATAARRTRRQED